MTWNAVSSCRAAADEDFAARTLTMPLWPTVTVPPIFVLELTGNETVVFFSAAPL